MAFVRGGVWAGALGALLLSAAIELAQLGIPGRHSTPSDLVANGLGGLVGGLLGVRPSGWLFPSGRSAVRAAAASTLAAAILLAAPGLLLRTTVPAGTTDRLELFAQWTPDLPSLERYEGRLLDARVDGERVPHGLLEGNRTAVALERDPLEVRLQLELGPPTPGLAPLLRLVDEVYREAFQVGVDGDALVVRYRYRADELRLARPDVRVKGWVDGRTAGDTVTVVLRRTGDGLTHVRVDEGPTTAHGVTAAEGWRLLRGMPGLSAGQRELVSLLWVFGLALPAGWWSGSLARALPGALALAGLLLALPAWTPLLPTPWLHLAAAFTGAWAGAVLRSITVRRKW